LSLREVCSLTTGSVGVAILKSGEEAKRILTVSQKRAGSGD
jgi:hypothetical protein